MSDLSTFEQYYKLADQLIEKSSKENIAECAKLLALNVAHYQSKYGELPLDETLAMIGMTEPNNEQLELMAAGMEVLVGVCWEVCATGWTSLGINHQAELLQRPNKKPGNRYRGCLIRVPPPQAARWFILIPALIG